jgi:uncharacterized protein YycO
MKRFKLLPTLLLEIPIGSFSHRISESDRQTMTAVLEAGDILLTSDRPFPLWRWGAAVLGSPLYCHAAMYTDDNRIVEATTCHPSGKGVVYRSVRGFLSGRRDVCILRPAYRSEEDRRTVLAWLCRQVGKPYDYGFNSRSEQAMYCSKLVAMSLQQMGLSVTPRRIFWRYGIYLPDSLLRISGARTVYASPRRKAWHDLPFAVSITILPWYPIVGAVLWGVLAGVGLLQYMKRI